MMSVLISGLSFIYGYNMSVAQNTSRQESVLRGKSNSVCYHAVHESVAMDESLFGQILRKENVASRSACQQFQTLES